MNDMLVWQDDSTFVPLKLRIERAVCYYKEKYNRPPTTILLHKDEGIEETELCGVDVRPSNIAMKYHFLVGIEEKAAFNRSQ